MAVRVGSYSMIFAPIGILVLLTIAFPLCLRRVPVSNWAESYTVDPRKFRRPETIKELIELIHKNEEVRCVGAMHSCAPLVMSDGIIISFEKLNKILEVDAQNATATVQPGVKIHDLCEVIKPHGLAMGTLGTIDWQTVVGAVMTGTYGGSLTTPSLHDFVESYTLVKADGEFMTVTREDSPELFSAMAPCMGVFGVVVECKIRLVKLTYLEAEMESMPFKDVISMFKDLMEGNTHARVVVYPSLDLATVWKASPIEKKGGAVARGAFKSKGYINFRDEHEKALLEEFLVHQKRGAYEKADDFLKKTVNSQLIRLSHYEGDYNHILCKERNHGILHADIEFGMDFAKAEEVLTAVREWYLTEGNRVPYYNFEIRTTKQDYAMMSCCYARDTLFIDFQAKASVGSHLFPKMEELMAPFGYRKYWAKGMCHSNPGYIVSQFPNVEQFIELIGEHDPKGKFRNEHIRLWYDKIKKNVANTQKTPTDEEEKAEDLAAR